MIYSTEKKETYKSGLETAISKTSILLNYAVTVFEGQIKLSPGEHLERVLETKEELDGLDMTNAMRVVVQGAYNWATNK